MKQYAYMLVLYLGWTSACPTCIGTKRHESSAPFFSDEHYQTQKTDAAANPQSQEQSYNGTIPKVLS